jgi:hypothetical protein
MAGDLIEELNGEGKVFEGDTLVGGAKYRIRVYQNYAESTDLATGVTSRTATLPRYELAITWSSPNILWGEQLYTLHTSRKNTLDKLNFCMLAEGRPKVTGGWF